MRKHARGLHFCADYSMICQAKNNVFLCGACQVYRPGGRGRGVLVFLCVGVGPVAVGNRVD